MTDRRDGVDDRGGRFEAVRLAVLVGAAVLAGEMDRDEGDGE